MPLTKEFHFPARQTIIGVVAVSLTLALFAALASISGVRTGVEAALNASAQAQASAEVRHDNESLQSQLIREQKDHDQYKAVTYGLVQELRASVDHQRREIGYYAARLRTARGDATGLKEELDRLHSIRTYAELLAIYGDAVEDMPKQ